MAPALLDMAGQRGQLPLPLLLLSLAGLTMLNLVLGTTATDVTATMSPAHPASLTPMETSSLLPTSASTTTATVHPSSPEIGVSTLETFSTSPGSKSTSPATISPPTTPVPTIASSEPLTTLSNTMATSYASTRVTKITSDPSQPAGTTPGISTLTVRPTLGTLTTSQTPSAATGMESSSPDTGSTPTPEVTLNTPANVSTMLPICPSATSNTSASHLFLSLRLTVPLDLGNSTVQELVLSKLRGDLQIAFPCAGLAVKWRGQKRT